MGTYGTSLDTHVSEAQDHLSRVHASGTRYGQSMALLGGGRQSGAVPVCAGSGLPPEFSCGEVRWRGDESPEASGDTASDE